MEYLPYIWIPSAIVVYIMTTIGIAHLLTDDEPFVMWFFIHFVLVMAGVILWGIHHDFGTHGLIVAGCVILGLFLPVAIVLSIIALVAFWPKRAEAKPQPALPPTGDYIDVTYSEPIHTTVADICVD